MGCVVSPPGAGRHDSDSGSGNADGNDHADGFNLGRPLIGVWFISRDDSWTGVRAKHARGDRRRPRDDVCACANGEFQVRSVLHGRDIAGRRDSRFSESKVRVGCDARPESLCRDRGSVDDRDALRLAAPESE